MERKLPKVGVAAIIIRDGKVLVGRRVGAHGHGTWSFPGGHLEFGEEAEQGIAREVKEGTGMDVVGAPEWRAYTNDIFREEGKHYVTLYFACDVVGEPKIMEPDCTDEWRWSDWNSLPQPLFLPLRNLIQQGFNPFEE